MSRQDRDQLRKGRGAKSNLPGRFDQRYAEAADDGWAILEEPLEPLHTEVYPEAARSIIATNNSPDIPFSQSINPYRGCEHGCVYCYARPSHAYVDLSPGLDFETQLFYKQDAAALLRKALAAKKYQCSPIALGANTDPYQPIERQYAVTRSILETLSSCNHPVTIVTKGAAIIRRDIDLLADMAARNLVSVAVSITTLEAPLKRTLEPRAASPSARLAAISMLAEAAIPVSVMVAPVIPALTDHELEPILNRSAEAGAESATYVMLRLPYEVKPLFEQWLQAHQPLKATHVMSLLTAMHAGKAYDSSFGKRRTGAGVFAKLFAARFQLACRKLGLAQGMGNSLSCDQFTPPENSPQIRLL